MTWCSLKNNSQPTAALSGLSLISNISHINSVNPHVILMYRGHPVFILQKRKLMRTASQVVSGGERWQSLGSWASSCIFNILLELSFCLIMWLIFSSVFADSHFRLTSSLAITSVSCSSNPVPKGRCLHSSCFPLPSATRCNGGLSVCRFESSIHQHLGFAGAPGASKQDSLGTPQPCFPSSNPLVHVGDLYLHRLSSISPITSNLSVALSAISHIPKYLHRSAYPLSTGTFLLSVRLTPCCLQSEFACCVYISVS